MCGTCLLVVCGGVGGVGRGLHVAYTGGTVLTCANIGVVRNTERLTMNEFIDFVDAPGERVAFDCATQRVERALRALGYECSEVGMWQIVKAFYRSSWHTALVVTPLYVRVSTFLNVAVSNGASPVKPLVDSNLVECYSYNDAVEWVVETINSSVSKEWVPVVMSDLESINKAVNDFFVADHKHGDVIMFVRRSRSETLTSIINDMFG